MRQSGIQRRAWRRGLFLAVVLEALVGVPLLNAQEDPFGDGAVPARSTPVRTAPAAAAPAAGGAAERDPAIQSILASAPKQPEELMQAAFNLVRLARPDLARGFLNQLENAGPAPEVLAALQARFGSDFFLRLARDPALQPEGARVSQAVATAAQAVSRDPARLAQLIQQLGSTNPTQRRQATLALRQVGSPAVPPLIQALADDSQAALHPRIQTALVELGAAAIEPLVGALESTDTALRQRSFETLGRLNAQRALSYFVRPAIAPDAPAEVQAAAREALVRISGSVPDQQDAAHFLRRRIADLLGNSPPIRLDYENAAELWHWDEAAKAVVPRRYAHRELCAVEATRVARELYQLEPDSIDNRRLYLAADLESAKLLVGLDQPLPNGAGTAVERARSLGLEAVEDLLQVMMRQKRTVPAACAAEVLATFEDDSVVRSDDGTPRALVLAANSADRRLRVAATQAILKLNPREPFAGSNYVTDTLGFLAGSVGSRRVLVAHPKLEQAQTLVGLLAQLGYAGDAVTSGRSAFVMATKQPDYEFILLSDVLDGPTARELLPQLRHERRTSGIPVGILVELVTWGTRGGEESATASVDETPSAAPAPSVAAGPPHRSNPIVEVIPVRRGSAYFDRTPSPVDPLIKVRQWTLGDALTEAVARPFDEDGVARVLEQMKAGAARNIVPLEVRLEHARWALQSLATLADEEQPYGFYEVAKVQPQVDVALQTAELMIDATRVLGRLGSPKAQVALVDLASQNALPLDARQAAAEAFGVAVSRRGLRLTKVEVLRQYERYNRSERLDAATQQLLGRILDTLEGTADPTRDAVEETTNTDASNSTPAPATVP